MRIKLLTAFSAGIALMQSVPSVQAMPAWLGPIAVTQPDGTTVTVRLHGDERCNWLSTSEGFTLMRDDKGFLNFVSLGTDSKPCLSGIRYRGSVGEAMSAGIIPGIAPVIDEARLTERRTASSDYNVQIDGTFPSKGKRKLLLLLLNYKNTTPVYQSDDFNDFMNKEGFGNIGSFRDYYLENSYGQLDITTTVTRWITLPGDKYSYGADGASSMIYDALCLIDDEIDLRDFDNDGDGILDGLAVIHQGPGQEATANPGDIWSHSGTLYGMEFDGVQVRRYTIQPELFGTGSTMSTIGVMCHEFGHNLGAPDFYDSDYSASGGEYPGTGVWDLMGSGAWNGKNGNRPAGTNMWQKIQLGWADAKQLDDDTDVSGMKGSTFVPEAYRFDTNVAGEYFIMENRQREGNFDVALPGSGLLIYHVSEPLIERNLVSNTLNASYPQALYTVCAGSGYLADEFPSSYGNVNADFAPFPGTRAVHDFNDRTAPSTRSNDGRFSYRALSGITENTDGTVSFRYSKEKAPASPREFRATVNRGVITLTWLEPEGSGKPVSYNIYRNGEPLATTAETQYVDDSAGEFTECTYMLDAEYSDGLISPHVTAGVRIPQNKAKDLKAVAQESSVKLDWTLDPRLTRMNGGENFSLADISAGSLDMVHRFRADDLKLYRGYRIRKIAFYPCQPKSEISCSLCIWESEPGASAPSAKIAERKVSEFGNMVWSNLSLRTPVEITGDKDLWIGVRVESTVKNITVISDIGPVVKGYGNIVRVDDGAWEECSSINGNLFLYATVALPADGRDFDVEIPDGPAEMPLDMFFPYAYAVYRDGDLLGMTSVPRFTDEAPLDGTHVYSVASLYKGGNESGTVDAEVNVDLSAVDDVAASHDEIRVDVTGGVMSVCGFSGCLSVFDVTGRCVMRNGNYESGTPVNLRGGFYVVKAGAYSQGVVIP